MPAGVREGGGRRVRTWAMKARRMVDGHTKSPQILPGSTPGDMPRLPIRARSLLTLLLLCELSTGRYPQGMVCSEFARHEKTRPE